MMSLSLWLPGAMFLLGGSLCLVSCSFWGSGGSLSRGSVSMGVSVQGVSVQSLCPGGYLSEGVPLSWGSHSGRSLSRQGLCPRGLPDKDPLPPTETPLYGEEWVLRILLECFLCWCPFFVLAPSSVWQILDQLLQIQLMSITSKFRVETDKRIPFKTKQNKTEIPINLPTLHQSFLPSALIDRRC